MLVVATALLSGGCGGEDPDGPSAGRGEGGAVSVVVDPETVEPGGTLEARVRNRSDEPVSYGLAYRLQREVGGEFTEVELPDRAVIQIALVADPGETGPPVPVEVPKDAEPGTWRVILGPVGAGELLSAEFEVLGD